MKTGLGIAGANALPLIAVAGWLAWQVGDSFMEMRPPSCSEMLPEAQVREVVAAHPDLVGRIEAAGAMDLAVVSKEEGPCRGRAYLLIGYDTGATKKRIRKLIGRSFFGVPVRWQNW